MPKICQSERERQREKEREREGGGVISTTVIHHNPRYQIYQKLKASLLSADPVHLPEMETEYNSNYD